MKPIEDASSVDSNIFPNIRALSLVCCILSFTSVVVKRSFSALRRATTFMRSIMSDQRLTELLFMAVHSDVDVNTDHKGISGGIAGECSAVPYSTSVSAFVLSTDNCIHLPGASFCH